MKHITKKQILIILTVLPLSVQAWENCGQIDGEDSNCEYQVSSDGVLTIRPIDNSQDAMMPEYSYSQENLPAYASYRTTAPWYDERRNITRVQIEDGIQNISNNSFMEMRWLETVDMADSVVSTGSDAFTNAVRLTDINLSKNLKAMHKDPFQDADNLRTINLPEGLNSVRRLFNGADNMTALSIPDSLIDSKNFSLAALENSNIQTLYCSKEKEQACADYIKKAQEAGYAPQGLSYQLYEKYGNGYVYGGKFYANLGDIGTTKHIKKRIYTIDEANKVTGKTNRVSIKYR